MKKLIDVYPYRIDAGNIEFLLLKRSLNKIYAHQWRMIGGKVRENEKYHQAAWREFREETGLTPGKYWVVPSVNSFYEAKTDQIHQIPAFAVELKTSNSTPILDDEHVDFKWISLEHLDQFISWPEQKRLIRLIAELVNHNQILPEWILDISSYSS